jgi:hypothetical protein
MYKNLTLILFVALILCSAALCNKFPLVTTATGSYINGGFSKLFLADSTIIYGLFIAHASWGLTLWLVIISQSLIVSIVLYYYFKYFSGVIVFQPYYLICVCFLACFSYISVITSTIGPGVFAAVSILSVGFLLFTRNVNKLDYAVMAVIAVFSISIDASYLISILLVTLVSCVSIMIHNRNRQPAFAITSIRRGLASMFVIAVSFLLISISNFFFVVVVSQVKDADAFMTYQLRNEGIASTDLHPAAKMKENSGKTGKKYLLVPVKIQSDGGAENKLYPKTRSKSSATLAWYDLTKTAIKEFPAQIAAFDINDYKNTGESTETFRAIFKWYGGEGREFLIARQFQDWLTLQYLNYAQVTTVLISCIVFFLAIRKRSSSRVSFFYCFLSVMVIVFVDLLFYGRSHKITEQVIWVILLPPWLYIAETYSCKNGTKPVTKPLPPHQNQL